VTPASEGGYQATTLAGGGTNGYQDGAGAAAQFSYLMGNLALDAADNVYVADSSNHRIRKITPDGTVSTLAGGGSGFADGTGTAAKFSNPKSLTLGPDNNLYVADTGNQRIRKVTLDGVVTTLVGNGTSGSANGSATSASFTGPNDLGFSADGSLYVIEAAQGRVRRIASGSVSLALSLAELKVSGAHAAIAPNGTLYVTHPARGQINAWELTGSATSSVSVSGLTLSHVTTIGLDGSGNLYVWNANLLSNTGQIAKIAPDGTGHVIAGGSVGYVDDVPALNAQFKEPGGFATDASGNLYLTDPANCRIRKLTKQP
jgi:sugar lactone lactonase YvrE